MNTEFYFVLIIAILASTSFFSNIFQKIDKLKFTMNVWAQHIFSWTLSIVNIIFYIGIFFLCAMYLISDSYNPFIYYRF